MIELGATVALTADHGMADKSDRDGRPNVVYAEDALNERFGAGSVRVICPIADPFVRHHGALGGLVRVHLLKPGALEAMITYEIGRAHVLTPVTKAQLTCRLL